MKTQLKNLLFALALAAGAAWMGCSSLRPVRDATRYFVLSPTQGLVQTNSAAQGPAIGLARVIVPDYLRSRKIAVRKANHEITYLDQWHWAEDLDQGIQRTLAARLTSIMHPRNLFLSNWSKRDVQAELMITLEQFEWNEDGLIEVKASWRISSPSGTPPDQTGHYDGAAQSSSAKKDPNQRINLLIEQSEHLADQLAGALGSGVRKP